MNAPFGMWDMFKGLSREDFPSDLEFERMKEMRDAMKTSKGRRRNVSLTEAAFSNMCFSIFLMHAVDPIAAESIIYEAIARFHQANPLNPDGGDRWTGNPIAIVRGIVDLLLGIPEFAEHVGKSHSLLTDYLLSDIPNHVKPIEPFAVESEDNRDE